MIPSHDTGLRSDMDISDQQLLPCAATRPVCASTAVNSNQILNDDISLIHTVSMISSVQMALICFEPDFIDKHRPDSLSIRFIHESRMGDSIMNHTYPTDVPDTYLGITTNGLGQELCRVTSHWREKEPLSDITEFNYIRNK